MAATWGMGADSAVAASLACPTAPVHLPTMDSRLVRGTHLTADTRAIAATTPADASLQSVVTVEAMRAGTSGDPLQVLTLDVPMLADPVMWAGPHTGMAGGAAALAGAALTGV